MNRITLNYLRKLKREQQKFACLTAYDASFAHIMEHAGIEVILVGDSLGMVIQGHDSTLPVTMEDMLYHCKLVHRGTQRALLMVDMPFMTYATPETALINAARLMREGYAQVVKLEGGAWLTETVKLLTERGIPVCGHLGLTPQSVHQFGGYVVQGRRESEATQIYNDALALQAAGASLVLLECVPVELTRQITHALEIPVIGIGAGRMCDGQILVLYDMLGITVGKRPSFSKDFLAETGEIGSAIKNYVSAVKTGEFPSDAHSFGT
ncbi:3-methyl-2-oxobutanoate hydroxymethyltransferase [Thioflexithrix psekupsensis]|uniref:3-methyl-2-oxobutanoate hydroxymethyltransferase n=1 Tax=Thioflexithrix psekupsensis TaxID=1570016 RepID=A0A251X9T5_9GAMM|nr:3-methyl-2-oxobutanoate hydroxymethyltransferase [Thioflexithrix psekupsensis]OUD15010.1 3-methyl-2-oxobutanoate hydroxymethyltransferase [Thioflexithrix psekupsensis]